MYLSSPSPLDEAYSLHSRLMLYNLSSSYLFSPYRTMNLKFSLILIDDAVTPIVHRPLTSFTAALRDANDIIEPTIASNNAGPNKYVVCITDNFSSWTAFQV